MLQTQLGTQLFGTLRIHHFLGLGAKTEIGEFVIQSAGTGKGGLTVRTAGQGDGPSVPLFGAAGNTIMDQLADLRHGFLLLLLCFKLRMGSDRIKTLDSEISVIAQAGIGTQPLELGIGCQITGQMAVADIIALGLDQLFYHRIHRKTADIRNQLGMLCNIHLLPHPTKIAAGQGAGILASRHLIAFYQKNHMQTGKL